MIRYSALLRVSLLSLLLTACGDHQNAQPHTQPAPAKTEGIRFDVSVVANVSVATLPLQLRIANHSNASVKIITRQSFLIDTENQAWPLLTADQFGQGHQSDKDALTGFAVSFNADNNNLIEAASKILRNPYIAVGQTVYGVLFFPKREPAQTVRGLRLCYEQTGQTICTLLPASVAN